MCRAIDQWQRADIAVDPGDDVHCIEERAVTAEAAILDNQRNVVDAPARGQREPVRLLLVDDQQAGQSLDDLRRGRGIKMRMEPERGGGLVDGQRSQSVRFPTLCRIFGSRYSLNAVSRKLY
ncbi:hypothetical protein CBA19CS11_37880 [Caballeronia novacaledonica]|uniref:hypothetical protein n=1 Tax=Caballeronia novacaledonica TaxID=1544861 RepID=UPI001EE2565B|nr:hypothetical protein [Caballeronia novacaledonica]GJH14736.1 hypothetical protein CBA19CS11_37880 [Caballeronia novacaledonica]